MSISANYSVDLRVLFDSIAACFDIRTYPITVQTCFLTLFWQILEAFLGLLYARMSCERPLKFAEKIVKKSKFSNSGIGSNTLFCG